MTTRHRTTHAAALLGAAAALTACGSSVEAPTPFEQSCSIPIDQFFDGGIERTGIPSLMNPKLARRATPDIAYLTLGDPVIAFMFNDQPVAIPHKFMWHHEVLNMEIPGEAITVTYSPLTGASAVYDRTPTAQPPMEISQYVLNSGLVLAEEGGSLRPQMSTVATCGPGDGTAMSQIPFQVMSLAAWIGLHLDTWIASSDQGHDDILYTLFPYGLDYLERDNSRLIYPVEGGIDPRHEPKDVVFGVRAGTGGMAFSHRHLDQLRGALDVFVSVANATIGGQQTAVFWNATAQSARAYVAEAGGQTLHFELVGGRRVDVETGTSWNFLGEGFDGPLDGEQLEEIEDTIVSYWFAWAAYQPDTEIWSPPITASLLPVTEIGMPDVPVDRELVIR